MKIYHSLNNSENLEIGFLRRKKKNPTTYSASWWQTKNNSPFSSTS